MEAEKNQIILDFLRLYDNVLKTYGESSMQMTIEKTCQLTFDTDTERQRIEKAFSKHKDPMVKQKLLELIEMVEKEKWEEAAKELDGKWWHGYDDEDECPRLEYLGIIKHKSFHFDRWLTYLDLIIAIAVSPNNYKVIK